LFPEREGEEMDEDKPQKPKTHIVTAALKRATTDHGQWAFIEYKCPCGMVVQVHAAGADLEAAQHGCEAINCLLEGRQLNAECPGCGARLKINKGLAEMSKCKDCWVLSVETPHGKRRPPDEETLAAWAGLGCEKCLQIHLSIERKAADSVQKHIGRVKYETEMLIQIAEELATMWPKASSPRAMLEEYLTRHASTHRPNVPRPDDR
jgi:hypothetical protein